jgi:ubiquinone/menaquinone biosynthesis C-methylase UbiE
VRDDPAHAAFFDMQSALGITTHMGGMPATRELLAMCRIERAHDVLDVGCGIGVGPSHLAAAYRCQVVGADRSLEMLRWSRRRSRQQRVARSVHLLAGDVTHLPLSDNRFDVVVCESVLTFVTDQEAAVRELVRVTRPGGYVGLNEGLWLREPPPRLAESVRRALGPSVNTRATWESIWERSGLEDRVLQVRHVEARDEIGSRIDWIGWRWIVPAWGRALRLAMTNPAMRGAMREQLGVSAEVFRYAGYALMSGRKPRP